MRIVSKIPQMGVTNVYPPLWHLLEVLTVLNVIPSDSWEWHDMAAAVGRIQGVYNYNTKHDDWMT